MKTCSHSAVDCLNPYDYIRKYRCRACKGVMLCACDREIGERFLPHQLKEGTDMENRKTFAVTHGFQPAICNECRGLPLMNKPVAAIYGRTSKIERYYWREIAFELMRRLGELPGGRESKKSKEERKRAEKEVHAEFQALHATKPKYTYLERSQADVLAATNTQVISVAARHVPQPAGGILIECRTGAVTPERFAEEHFEQLGYECVRCESRPFHALFGIYMYLVIQDIADPRNRTVMFGSRTAFDQKARGVEIRTTLPEDFGAEGYYARRRKAIARHFMLLEDSDWLFDYWTGDSQPLREYLWAHRPEDVAAARQIRTILGTANLRKVLLYLVKHYWHHYLGWPDLLVFRNGEFFFVEVKSSKDRLSEDQKRWIIDNHEQLKFRFKLFKITSPSSQRRSTDADDS
jgi:hypothetical protein